MAELIEIAHPRDVYAYDHAAAVETAFLSALDRNRLHHGWLLTGPEGMGKATFAYRAARRLLGAAPDPAYGPMGAAPHDAVSRLVAARSHPDLMVLERVGDDGKARKVIPVDEARRLPEFFSKSPSMARWRVAIVDAVDDMNANSANALLKILEEPPQLGIILLVSHAPGGLLPTIRSRCRRMSFGPWSEAHVIDFMEHRLDASDEDLLRLARMARGSPGRALDLAAKGALALDQAARELLARLPDSDMAAAQALSEGFRGTEGGERFAMLLERLGDHVRIRAEQAAGEGGRDSDRWAEVWSQLVALPGEVDGLNLDRADAFWTAFGALRGAARA